MVVDAGDANAVVRTKPDDWRVDPEPKLAGVFSSHASRIESGSHCVFADGSVRFLRETIYSRLLRALLTYKGGEALSSDDC